MSARRTSSRTRTISDISGGTDGDTSWCLAHYNVAQGPGLQIRIAAGQRLTAFNFTYSILGRWSLFKAFLRGQADASVSVAVRPGPVHILDLIVEQHDALADPGASS